MGMYDEVHITCPHCGKEHEDQTKAFDCILQRIDLNKPVPTNVATEFNGKKVYCSECSKPFIIGSFVVGLIQLNTMKL